MVPPQRSLLLLPRVLLASLRRGSLHMTGVGLMRTRTGRYPLVTVTKEYSSCVARAGARTDSQGVPPSRAAGKKSRDNRQASPPAGLSDKYVRLNRRIINRGSEEDWAGLCALVQNSYGQRKKRLDFTQVNCSTWLHRWSKRKPEALSGPPPPEVVMVLRCCGMHLHKKDDNGFQELKVVSLLANAVCKLQYDWGQEEGGDERQPLMQAIEAWSLQHTLHDLTPFAAAHLLNAMARVGGPPPSPAFLDLITSRLLSCHLHPTSPQSTALLLNGLSRLHHHPGDEFLALLCHRCEDCKLHGYGPQALCLLLGGLSRFNHPPSPQLLQHFEDRVAQIGLSDFTPQALANLVNSLGRLKISGGRALPQRIADECVARGLSDFSSTTLGILLHAYGRLGAHPGDALLSSIVQALEARGVEDCSPRDVVNVMTGLAALGHHPGHTLLEALANRGQAVGFADFHGPELASVLHDLALFDYPEVGKGLEAFWARGGEVGWEKLSYQALQKIVWGAAAAGVPLDEAVMDEIRRRLEEAGGEGKEEGEEGGGEKEQDEEDGGKGLAALCTALAQHHFLCVPGEGQAGLYDVVTRVWPVVKQGGHDPEVRPRLHGDVAAALQAAGHEVTEGAAVLDGFVCVDLVRSKNGEKVAVEVEGQDQFFINRPEEATGQTRVRRRLLGVAVSRGEIKAWVGVRGAGAEEMQRVEEALRRAEGGQKE